MDMGNDDVIIHLLQLGEEIGAAPSVSSERHSSVPVCLFSSCDFPEFHPKTSPKLAPDSTLIGPKTVIGLCLSEGREGILLLSVFILPVYISHET